MEMVNQFTEIFLRKKKKKGDLPADEFVAFFFENKERKSELFDWLYSLKLNSDLQKIDSPYSNFSLISEVNTLPTWYKQKEINTAYSFFSKHSELIMNLLGLLSLPYCYAAANGAMVLQQTTRLQNDVGKRLMETAEFVWDLMAPNAFLNDGRGFVSILKVRLMHAAARYYILKSNNWSDERGIPVNQEDMAGTNLSFSLIVIRGLRKLGLSIDYAEQSAFIHIWNVIGYLLGLDIDLLPKNGKEAAILEQCIRTRQFMPSDQGKALCKGLIDFLKTVAKNGSTSESELLGLMNYLLGNDIAVSIGLPIEKLPARKIKFIKIINSFKYLNANINVVNDYKSGYLKFQKEKLLLL